jgi:isoquinoline 1-oxidoreductase beta subunit
VSSRREFLKTGGASAVVLSLGFQLDVVEGPGAGGPAAGPSFHPNAFVELHRNGRILLTVAKSEMGQGVRTSLALVLAEELGVDLAKVDLVQASPGPDFKSLGTGGSTSVTTTFTSLRKAGAAAREMLVAAAAAKWGVAPEACLAKDAFIQGPGGKKLAYGALVEGALQQPVPKEPKLKAISAFTQIGHSRKRIDGPKIVSGRAQYGIDVKVPGMKVAVVTRCPVPGGKLKRLEDSKAKAQAGVRAVLQVPSGVAVVADGAHAALQGSKRLLVEWELGPQGAFDSASFWKGLQDLAAAQEGRPVRTDGNVEGAFASPQHRAVTADYLFPWQAHATLEPMNCVAEVKAGGCEIWCGTQSPNKAQSDVAMALGLKPEQVKVNVTLLGGGFGRRIGSDFVVEAALVAKAAGVPVKVIWRRDDDLRHDLYHPGSLHRLRAALDPKGRPAAWAHRVAAPSILRSWSGQDSPGIPHAECIGAEDLPYAIPAVKVDYVEAPSAFALGWWRAIQIVPNVYARECFLDELAHAAKADPLAYRLELLGRGRKMKASRGELDLDRLRKVLELVAEKAGWGTPLPAKQGRKWGRGIACHCYEGQTCVAEVAEVSVGPKGDLKVHRVVVAADCGLVLNPDGAKAQIEGGILWGLAAMRNQITFKDGRVEQGDFLDFPLPRIQDMPQVEVHLIASEAHPTGMGEPPVPPSIPAILNAAFAATGKRVRRLPLAERDLA